MAVTGEIAERARGYLPETWSKLGDPKSGTGANIPYGDDFLRRHVDAVMRRYLGDTISENEQEALPEVVLEFLSLRLALRLIIPGIDFWSKQAVQMGASGRNETKTWAQRAQDLRELKKYLEAEVASISLEAEALLPVLTQAATAAVPVVVNRDTTSFTPDPDSIEPVYDRSREQYGPRG